METQLGDICVGWDGRCGLAKISDFQNKNTLLSVLLEALLNLNTNKHTTLSPEAVAGRALAPPAGCELSPCSSLSLARKRPADVSEADGVASRPRVSQEKTLSLGRSS